MFIFKRKQPQTEAKQVIHEVSHGFIGKIKEKAKGIVYTGHEQNQRVPHPQNMNRYAELCMDPTVAVSIDIKKNAIVPDFYFEMPEQQEGETVKIKIEAVVKPEQPTPTQEPDKPAFKQKQPEKPKQKKKHPNQLKLEAWKKNTKAVKKIKEIVGVALSKGFCAFTIEDDYSLKVLPSESVYKYRDKYGKILKYTQEENMRVIQTWQTPSELEKFVFFANDEDPDHPYGEADVESLVTLLDSRSDLNVDMGKIIHRFSAPLIIVRASGSAADVKQSMLDKDIDEALFLGKTNKDEVEILVVEPDPQCKFIPYIDSIDFQIGQRLNAPTMLLLKNSTEASATKMLDAFNVWVQSFQNELSELLEERVFKKIVTSGLMPIMRFGAPKEVLDELTLADINNAVDKSISKRQAQDLIRKKGIELIEDEEWLNKTPEPFGSNPFDKTKIGNVKPETEFSTEAIEKLNDLHATLDLIETCYREQKKPIVEVCRMAEQAIRVYMQRSFPDDWQQRYEAAFKQFIHERLGERLGGQAKKQQVFTVKVD